MAVCAPETVDLLESPTCLGMVCAGLCKCAKWNVPVAHRGQHPAVRKSDGWRVVTVALPLCWGIFLLHLSKRLSILRAVFYILVQCNLYHRVLDGLSEVLGKICDTVLFFFEACVVLSRVRVHCVAHCRLMWLIGSCYREALITASG